MSSQRTSPASFSRLKEMLPAPGAAPSLEQGGEGQPAVLEVPTPVVHPVATQPVAIQPATVQHVAIQSPGVRSALAARPGKRLQHTKPATFRLPIELIEALKDVAQHNNLNMTDIVAEAVWLHLENFQWPSGLEAKRGLLAAHFAAPAKY